MDWSQCIIFLMRRVEWVWELINIKHKRPSLTSFPSTKKIVDNMVHRVKKIWYVYVFFWKFGQTLSWVLDISSYSKLKLGKKQRNKIVKMSTVKPLVATISCKQPPLLSYQFFKIAKFSSQITIFGTPCKRTPRVSDHNHF